MSDNIPLSLPNEHLGNMDSDELFHLGIALDDAATVGKFTNVKFVLVAGTRERMESLARHLATSVLGRRENGDNLFDHSFQNSRYAGYLVGPIFCVNHGIGNPSLSIVLHEVFKLLSKAGCSNVSLIRLGTCGGIGVEIGTLVITSKALTVGLEPFYNTSCLGQPLRLPSEADETLAQELFQCRQDSDDFSVVMGNTYCADDFYQGQGRLDGSFCDYDEHAKQDFLKMLQEKDVVNIEMESAGVLGLAKKVGVKAAVMCVVIVNRLDTDLPPLTPKLFETLENRPIIAISRFIQRKLQHN